MSRAVVILTDDAARAKVASWAAKAPAFSRVEFKRPKRTLPQNDRLWATLTDIAEQVTHHGMKLSPADWKLLFLDALKREVRAAPSLDGTGFVNLGRSSSDLSKDEMSDLLEIINAWCAANNISPRNPEGVGG